MLSSQRLCITLLDLPDELLISCLPCGEADSPPSISDIRTCMAVCKRLLGVLLKGDSSGRLHLQLQVHGPEDIPSRRASLQLMTKACPNVHKLAVQTDQAVSWTELSSLLAVPADHKVLSTGWLQGVTQLCIERVPGVSQVTWCLLPHPIPDVMASACPNLKELRLNGVLLEENHYLARSMTQQICARCQEMEQLQLQQEQLRQYILDDPLLSIVGKQFLKLNMPIGPELFENMMEFMVGMAHDPAMSGPSPSPSCLPKLQQLTLHQCGFLNSPAAFQQQLQVLPSLTRLSLVRCDFQGDMQPYVATVADSCSDMLTSLEWNYISPADLQGLFSKPLVQLQHLKVARSVIDASMLQLLLKHAPQLRKVQALSFVLEEDLSHRQCRWDSVVISGYLSVGCLARMPLSHGPKLHVTSPTHVYLAGPEGGTEADALQRTAAAAAAVQRCGGIQACDEEHTWSVKTNITSASYIDGVLADSIPILSTTGRSQFQFSITHITRAILIAISNHLPHCHSISFLEGCTFEGGIWGLMVSLLPHVTSLIVASQNVTLHQLVVLCATATHPVTLKIDADIFDNSDDDEDDQHDEVWQDVLEQAVRDAGHGYVDIKQM